MIFFQCSPPGFFSLWFVKIGWRSTAKLLTVEARQSNRSWLLFMAPDFLAALSKGIVWTGSEWATILDLAFSQFDWRLETWKWWNTIHTVYCAVCEREVDVKESSFPLLWCLPVLFLTSFLSVDIFPFAFNESLEDTFNLRFSLFTMLHILLSNISKSLLVNTGFCSQAAQKDFLRHVLYNVHSPSPRCCDLCYKSRSGVLYYFCSSQKQSLSLKAKLSISRFGYSVLATDSWAKRKIIHSTIIKPSEKRKRNRGLLITSPFMKSFK